MNLGQEHPDSGFFNAKNQPASCGFFCACKKQTEKSETVANPNPVPRTGRPNKNTVALRETITAFIENNAVRAQELFETVAENNPGDALKIYFGCLDYAMPRLARTENTTELKGQLPTIKVEVVRPGD